MSVATWINEFYPVPVEDVPENDDGLKHSILKWRGLQPENLSRHGVVMQGRNVRDNAAIDQLADVFAVGGDSCVLCERYFITTPRSRCDKCPLAIARSYNGVPTPCDMERPGEASSPWMDFAYRGNPRPMLHWLRVAADEE